MKVGIVGGGFTGLTTAHELLKKGYEVAVFESQPYWGGLSSAFEVWPGVWVERFYHHLFTNDAEALSLCRELGVSGKLRFLDGKTSHFYGGRIYPLDDPLAVLKFAPLSWWERVRFGGVTLFLKLEGDGERFGGVTAQRWLTRWYGEKAYRIVWEPLLKGKFSDRHDKVSMTWFWARVKKRTPRLIYPEGGFQTVVEALVRKIRQEGGELYENVVVGDFEVDDFGRWGVRVGGGAGQALGRRSFDKLVCTTSLKTFSALFSQLPQNYRQGLSSIEYLSSQILILVLSRKLSPHYWINIGETSFPFLVVGEQSNLLGLDYYRGKSVVYLGNYLADGDRRLMMRSDQLLDLYLPYLRRLNSDFERSWVDSVWTFVGPDAQPVMDVNYKVKVPPFKTPLPNLYLATMAQVYPWDRGINYAVKLAKDLVKENF